jgi:segregation and condensation protein A
MSNIPDLGASVPGPVPAGEPLNPSKAEPAGVVSEQPPVVTDEAVVEEPKKAVEEHLKDSADETKVADTQADESNFHGAVVEEPKLDEIRFDEGIIEEPKVGEIIRFDADPAVKPELGEIRFDEAIIETPRIAEIRFDEVKIEATPVEEAKPLVDELNEIANDIIEQPIQQLLPLPIPLEKIIEDRPAPVQPRKHSKKKPIALDPIVSEEPVIVCEAVVESPAAPTKQTKDAAPKAPGENAKPQVSPHVVTNELVKDDRVAPPSGAPAQDGAASADDSSESLTEAAEDLSGDGNFSLPIDAEQLIQHASGGEVAPSDGIEILVQLAQKGEIDPKNVDIIDVTDKFLKLIAAAPKENLRQSGKILFHACVLLRMKAEALLSQTADDDHSGDDFLDFDENGEVMDSEHYVRQITLKDLEKAIVRRSQRRQVRKRQVTLEELIDALREAERIEKIRAEKKPARAVIELAGQHDVDGVDDLLDLAHDEDVESTIEKVEILLARILKLGEKIELLQMVVLMDDHNDWVDAFLASLFLSNAGKIDLYQDEFYGPLFIGLGGSFMVSDTVVT